MGDDPIRLRAAATYLERGPEPIVHDPYVAALLDELDGHNRSRRPDRARAVVDELHRVAPEVAAAITANTTRAKRERVIPEQPRETR